MKTENNAKKLGLILCSILIIVLVILIVYTITSFFQLNDYEGELPTTTTTKPIDYGFEELSTEEKENFNRHFNRSRFLHALNNAIGDNHNLMNINLLGSEMSKFKFIFTYLNLDQPNNSMTLKEINEAAQKYFNTELNPINLVDYYNEDNENYYYNIVRERLDFCFKINSRKENILLIAKIKREGNVCRANITEYDEELIINQINLLFNQVNNDFIYNSYIIVK